MARDETLWAGAPTITSVDVRHSRTARLAWGLAAFSVPVGVLATAFHRLGLIDTLAFSASLGAAFLFAALGVLIATIALVRIWQVGGRGTGRAAAAAFLGAIVFAPAAFAIYLGVTLPRINDVTTDPVLVPRFLALYDARTAANIGTEYAVEDNWPKQTAAYPQVVPLRLDVDFDTAIAVVEDAVADQGWRVVQRRERDGNPRQVTFEAEAKTLIVGFTDDIVIRLSEGADFVRIDMRSASRFGEHDLGANARRIQGFFTELRDGARARTRV